MWGKLTWNWDVGMYSQATQFCSSALAAAGSDPEVTILGRNEVFLLLTNQLKLLVMLMNLRRRKTVVGGMAHRDSSHLVLESVSTTITSSPGIDWKEMGHPRRGLWSLVGCIAGLGRSLAHLFREGGVFKSRMMKKNRESVCDRCSSNVSLPRDRGGWNVMIL